MHDVGEECHMRIKQGPEGETATSAKSCRITNSEVKIEIKPNAVAQQGDLQCKTVFRDAEQTGQ